MKKKATLAAVVMVAVLAGCASGPGSSVSPEVEAAAREPLYCHGPEQCSVYWRRAQLWVASNSAWKIQTVTDALIVTYTPQRSSVERGYQITREPQDGGREQISIGSACANMFGCSTDTFQQAAKFKQYVKDVKPVQAAAPQAPVAPAASRP